jgi:hypothetical protein
VETHRPTSIDVPVVPEVNALTLSEVERDGHQSDPLDLASLEHAFAAIQRIRRHPARTQFADYVEQDATLDVALAAIYREICRRAPLAETVARPLSVRERMLVDLRAVAPVRYPRSDYGAALAAVGPDYDAPAGAGDDVEAFRG